MQLMLDDALEKLYLAFDGTPRPQQPEQVTACPCCVSDEELRALVRSDRRLLTGEELMPYIQSARTPITGEDYLYFFPRIVELTFLDDLPVEWSRVFDRLASIDPQSWTPQQRAGLSHFMSSLMAEVERLSDEAPDGDNLDWLIDDAISCLELSDLDPNTES